MTPINEGMTYQMSVLKMVDGSVTTLGAMILPPEEFPAFDYAEAGGFFKFRDFDGSICYVATARIQAISLVTLSQDDWDILSAKCAQGIAALIKNLIGEPTNADEA